MRINKKFGTIGIIVILYFVCILSCGCLSSESKISSFTSQIAERNYTNSESTYQVTYPNDWVIREANDYIYFTSGPSDGIINIDKNPRLTNISPENLEMILDELLINNITKTPGALIYENSTLVVANYPAVQVIYKEPEDSTKQIWIITIINNRVFLLRYFAEEEFFDKNFPKVMRIFNSIVVLDRSSTITTAPTDESNSLRFWSFMAQSMKKYLGDDFKNAVNNKNYSALREIGKKIENETSNDIMELNNILVDNSLDKEAKEAKLQFLYHYNLAAKALSNVTPANYVEQMKLYDYEFDQAVIYGDRIKNL